MRFVQSMAATVIFQALALLCPSTHAIDAVGCLLSGEDGREVIADVAVDDGLEVLEAPLLD